MIPAPSASSDRSRGRTVLWDAWASASAKPVFATLRPAIEALGSFDAFPSPEEIDARLAPLAGVRFVRQEKRPRRKRRSAPDASAAAAPSSPGTPSMYDARIVLEGVVPTREGSWHDLMNALVWATFPRAKRALHARQHTLVVPAKPGQSLRRPRELDALALVDEGGVLVVRDGAAEPRQVVFGHAVYEGVVLGWPAPVSAALEIALEGAGAATAGALPSELDRALEALVGDRERLKDPRDLYRVPIAV